jgi:hypothetical protein
MTHKVKLETEFIIPDDMDEENVRHVLDQFFVDLIKTDRFVDARIVSDSSLDETEEKRLVELLTEVNEGDLDKLSDFIDEYTDD